MASLGASLAVNCTNNVEKHLTEARRLGAGEDLVAEVVASVRKIRAVGIGHAERLVGAAQLPESQCAANAACC